MTPSPHGNNTPGTPVQIHWEHDRRFITYRIERLEQEARDRQEKYDKQHQELVEALEKQSEATDNLRVVVEGLKVKSGLIGAMAAGVALIGQHVLSTVTGKP